MVGVEEIKEKTNHFLAVVKVEAYWTSMDWEVYQDLTMLLAEIQAVKATRKKNVKRERKKRKNPFHP